MKNFSNPSDECAPEEVLTNTDYSGRDPVCLDEADSCAAAICECDLQFAKAIAAARTIVPNLYIYNLFLNGAARGDPIAFHPKRNCSHAAAAKSLTPPSENILTLLHCPSEECWIYNEHSAECEPTQGANCYQLECAFDAMNFFFKPELLDIFDREQFSVNSKSENACLPLWDSEMNRWKLSYKLGNCGTVIQTEVVEQKRYNENNYSRGCL